MTDKEKKDVVARGLNLLDEKRGQTTIRDNKIEAKLRAAQKSK